MVFNETNIENINYKLPSSTQNNYWQTIPSPIVNTTNSSSFNISNISLNNNSIEMLIKQQPPTTFPNPTSTFSLPFTSLYLNLIKGGYAFFFNL